MSSLNAAKDNGFPKVGAELGSQPSAATVEKKILLPVSVVGYGIPHLQTSVVVRSRYIQCPLCSSEGILDVSRHI